jgi:ABC-2 type transport system ATP-binding protein
VGVVGDGVRADPGADAKAALHLVAAAAGIGTDGVDDALERAGLTAAAGRAVGGFSLGMTRRLAVAAALLPSPALLVLDEPTNGLDPAGIAWLEGLLRDHRAAGGTTLMSTHLLDQAERVADEVVVLRRGSCAVVEAADAAAQIEVSCVAEDLARLLAALEDAGAELVHHGRDTAAVRGADAARVGRIAFDAHVPLTGLREADRGFRSRFAGLADELA